MDRAEKKEAVATLREVFAKNDEGLPLPLPSVKLGGRELSVAAETPREAEAPEKTPGIVGALGR